MIKIYISEPQTKGIQTENGETLCNNKQIDEIYWFNLSKEKKIKYYSIILTT